MLNMRQPEPYEGHHAARALERVLLLSMDLRQLLDRLRDAAPDQVPDLLHEAEQLAYELEELARAGRVPESEHE